jgi:hypothetical protein
MAYSIKMALCNKLCNAVLSGKPTNKVIAQLPIDGQDLPR